MPLVPNHKYSARSSLKTILLTNSLRKSQLLLPKSYNPTPPSRKQHTAWPGGNAYDVSVKLLLDVGCDNALLVEDCSWLLFISVNKPNTILICGHFQEVSSL